MEGLQQFGGLDLSLGATVNVSLGELDKLRSALIAQTKRANDLEEKQGLIKVITQNKDRKGVFETRDLGYAQYGGRRMETVRVEQEVWGPEHVTFKNLDEVLGILEEQITKTVTARFEGEITSLTKKAEGHERRLKEVQQSLETRTEQRDKLIERREELLKEHEELQAKFAATKTALETVKRHNELLKKENDSQKTVIKKISWFTQLFK